MDYTVDPTNRLVRFLVSAEDGANGFEPQDAATGTGYGLAEGPTSFKTVGNGTYPGLCCLNPVTSFSITMP
jgi:hypothetical protein